jgi:hypothetical protein
MHTCIVYSPYSISLSLVGQLSCWEGIGNGKPIQLFFDQSVGRLQSLWWVHSHKSSYLCRRYTMLRTPSNAGGLIVRRIVWPIFHSRTTDVERPTLALDHVPAVVGIFDRVKGLSPNVWRKHSLVWCTATRFVRTSKQFSISGWLFWGY